MTEHNQPPTSARIAGHLWATLGAVTLALVLLLLARTAILLWLDVQELRHDEPSECVGVVLS